LSATTARPIIVGMKPRQTFTKSGLALIALLPLGCSSSPSSVDATTVGDLLVDRAPGADLSRTDRPAGERSDAATRCPTFAAPVALGTLQSDQIDEASGLLASRTNADVFWAHNDSGDTARVFALNRLGQHLGVYELSGITAVDWEDIASGPGPTAGKEYLYLGDFGDNSMARASVAVYRVVEPTVSSSQPATTVKLSPVDTLALQYPDGAHNAETLLVDPLSGDLYIVTKSNDGVSGVYRSAAPHDTAAARVLTKVAILTFGAGVLSTTGTLAVGGDISPDGTEIMIRTYGAAVLWPRGSSSTIAAALAGTPCLLAVAFEVQGESITFDTQKSYYTVSEGLHPSLFYFARQ
jgi:hypothetical protein